MEIRYSFVIYIGIAFLLCLLFYCFTKNKKNNNSYKEGKKVAKSFYTSDDGYFKRKMMRFKLYTVMIFVCGFIAIGTSFFMISRPYTTEIATKNEYSRDIIFCVDISYSVDYLNVNIIPKIKEMVSNLKGERIGIVIFNSSPVLLSPLTDDYEFILEELDTIEEALKARLDVYETDKNGFITGYNYDKMPDNWDYLYAFITSGTLIGSDYRGSSLIGDGLASAIFDFSNDEKDEDRTKVIVLSTDNLLNGEPYVSLDECADICLEKNITLFGIGTKEMKMRNKKRMEEAVVKTGGSFYLEEESGNFDEMVEAIELKSKSLISDGTYLKRNDYLFVPYVILILSFVGMTVLIRITRR